MNPRIRLTSAKVEVGVEVEAELGNISIMFCVKKIRIILCSQIFWIP